MAELDLQPVDAAALTALQPTDAGWITCVLDDFESFIQDHASAEKKASGMALSMVAHYPDQAALVQAMVDLAVEELNHYKEVMGLLMAKGMTPAADRKTAPGGGRRADRRRGRLCRHTGKADITVVKLSAARAHARR